MARTILLSLLLGLWSQSFVIAKTGAKTGTGTCSPSDYELPNVNIIPNFADLPGDLAVMASIYSSLTDGIATGARMYETPMTIRGPSLADGASWNCVAAYDTSKVDAFRLERPVVTVPETVSCQGNTLSVHTTEARAQCMVHVYAAIVPTILPEAVGFIQRNLDFLGGYGDVTFGIDAAVQACASETDRSVFQTCVQAVAADHAYTPRIMASIIAQDTILYALDDGWNMDGTNDGACEYNCRPYADTTGYQPKNLGVGNSFMENWQPLLEDDGRGFFYRQEHVTPHLGEKAKPRMLTRQELEARTLPDPKYQYKQVEAPLVIDRLTMLDDKKKMEIEFFDNKQNLTRLIGLGLFFRYGATLTLERLLLFFAQYSAAQQDAVVLAWKEKVIHDKVRPTTVIQQGRYGTPRVITTWAGPGQGVETFDAKDFQPYIRVMPHAEYPSGSGCVCTVDRDSTYAFMKTVFQDDAADFVMFQEYVAGSSLIEPGKTPAENIQVAYTLESLRDTCGQSRLDGGMHFTAAVPDSYELCSDFGQEKFILDLLGGSTDLLTTYTPPARPPRYLRNGSSNETE